MRLRSLPAPDTLEGRADCNRVDVMWDYAAFPVWGRGSSIDLDRPIDVHLRNNLQEGSDRITKAMSVPNGPVARDGKDRATRSSTGSTPRAGL